MFKFEMGREAKDCITGFTGIIMSRSQYLTGCNQYGLSPSELTKEGKRPEWEFFDETRLSLTGKKIELPTEIIERKKDNGFDGTHGILK